MFSNFAAPLAEDNAEETIGNLERSNRFVKSFPVIASMTSTLGRPLSWMNLEGNKGDLTGMQNITSNLLKGLIGVGIPWSSTSKQGACICRAISA